MNDPHAFAKLVPGFDFLQGLLKNAGGSVPAMSQWIAPTLDPAELDKRIGDLRTVQFWLEQNAKLIATSIQALEVQRMTLATLQTMNLPMTGLRDAMAMRPPTAAPAPAAPPADEAPPAAAAPPRRPRAKGGAGAAGTAGAAGAAAERAGGAGGAAGLGVDPMQWWGALTQQFGQLAAKALEEVPGLDAVAGGAAASSGRAGQSPGRTDAAVEDAQPAPARRPPRKRPAAKSRARAR
jgi:hypothetical protein